MCCCGAVVCLGGALHPAALTNTCGIGAICESRGMNAHGSENRPFPQKPQARDQVQLRAHMKIQPKVLCEESPSAFEMSNNNSEGNLIWSNIPTVVECWLPANETQPVSVR